MTDDFPFPHIDSASLSLTKGSDPIEMLNSRHHSFKYDHIYDFLWSSSVKLLEYHSSFKNLTVLKFDKTKKLAIHSKFALL